MAHRVHVHHNTQTHYRCLHSQTKMHAEPITLPQNHERPQWLRRQQRCQPRKLNPIYRWSNAGHVLGLIGIIRGWLIPKLRNWDWVYLSHLAVYCWSVYRGMRIARNNNGHASYFAEAPSFPVPYRCSWSAYCERREHLRIPWSTPLPHCWVTYFGIYKI